MEDSASMVDDGFSIFQNETSTRDCFTKTYLYRMELMFIIFSISLVLNSHWVISLKNHEWFRPLPRPTRHLFYCNTLTTVLCIPVFIAWDATLTLCGDSCPNLCNIIEFIHQCTTGTTSYVVVVLNVYHYDKVLRRHKTTEDVERSCKLKLIIAWCLGTVYAFPELLTNEFLNDGEPQIYQCYDLNLVGSHENGEKWWIVLFVYKFICQFFIPASVGLFCQMSIFLKVRQMRTDLKAHKLSDTATSRNGPNTSRTPFNYVPLAMTIVFVVSYAICFGIWTYAAVLRLEQRPLIFPEWQRYIFTCVEYSGLCLYPVVYGIFQRSEEDAECVIDMRVLEVCERDSENIGLRREL